MTRFGYFLSSEEHDPAELVRQARLAEQAGFEALWISDHFHPWLDEQGNSPFAWPVIGAVSQVTSLPITTAVSCPLMRMNPAVTAQAAATCALLTGGKFTLGVGTGEALNEHILGDRWPSAEERLEMLEEAVEVIRDLFTGKLISHHGTHFTIDTARLYSLPPQPPPIYMSGFGSKSIKLAGRIADGYMSVKPDAEAISLFRESGGEGKITQGGTKVCWGPDAAKARETAHRLWRSEHVPGEAAQLLPLPRHFAQAAELVTEDMVSSPCGPDPEEHAEMIRGYVDAGFDEVYINQIGPDQDGFFEFYAEQVLPMLRADSAKSAGGA